MERFKEIEDGYLDTKTGLVWSKENGPKLSWKESIKYCSALGNGWRLPTIEELTSIIDYCKFSPATELPDMKSTYYWSISEYKESNDYGWTVYFYDGRIEELFNTSGHYTRPVRNATE